MSLHDFDVRSKAEMVGLQLDRICQSAAFRSSSRLTALLSFIIGETLAGRGEALKEATIGNAVYTRDPPYDPRIDSTVRVEARRLRRKLAEYYAAEGGKDALMIQLPLGSYSPIFATPESRAPVPFQPNGMLAILPLTTVSCDVEDEEFADDLTDELIVWAEMRGGVKVVPSAIAFRYKNSPILPATVMRELRVDRLILGTVRRTGDQIRVKIEFSDSRGFLVWSGRFAASHRETANLRSRVVDAVIGRLDDVGGPLPTSGIPLILE